ncbi:hypothetical protein GCM10009609_19440 [Pseudonocardia aurantiaca]|uniref:7-cyano-7-deazaguanine synthase n=1 Tax=Pseudonocardia aurantiaca TaxID=75290 RepID=A0ABW4FNK7_9PSEU
MGTSTGWRGPRWGDPLGASKRATRPEQIPFPRDGDLDVLDREWAARWSGRFLDKLWQDLRDDPDAYELRSRMTVMGRELVLAFAGLRDRGSTYADLTVLGEFTNRVAGEGTNVIDAVGRRAAVRAGERLFAGTGDTLFCLVYRGFFADFVAEFLRAVIAEEITAAVPALALVDPSGQIADWGGGSARRSRARSVRSGRSRPQRSRGGDRTGSGGGQRRPGAGGAGMTARSAPLRRFAFSRRQLSRMGWEHLSEEDFLDQSGRVTSAATMSGRAAPDWARDLLEIARAAFLVDKRFRRESAPDRWTRRIELLVQLRAPALWNEAVRRRVDALLGTLTGDQWQVSVHGGAAPEQAELELEPPRTVSAVALLSGGLDSACHAASLARADHGGSLLFVSFVDRVQEPQERVVKAVRKIGGDVIARHLDQRPRRGPDGKRLERSSRSRGFLYMAAAVHAAAAHGVRRVDVPENGQLAVNPPLTPARLGALSTRSVHPWTMYQFNQLITAVGGDVELVNPLLHLTKGEVCARGLESGLTEADLFATVSCGRHTHLGNRNCGCCFPCLVRRSGLLRAVGDDRSDYEQDKVEGDKARDLRAVQSWLDREFGERDLVADMPWPPGTTPRSVLPVLERGRAELTVARLSATVFTGGRGR